MYPDGSATSLRTMTLPNGVGYGSHYSKLYAPRLVPRGIRESTQSCYTVFPQSALGT